MKNLLGAVAETMRNTELKEAQDVAKKWAKKPLTPMKPKMKDPVAVRGVGVMEKDQATRLFPGVEHVSTRLHKEEVVLPTEELNEISTASFPSVANKIRNSHQENQNKKPLKTHKSSCAHNYGHDCDCGGTLTHASNCDHNYGQDCDCGLKEETKLDVPTPNVEELAKKHGVSLDEILSQLVKGVKIEMEHTTDREVANEIARDHIKEDPKYYDKLAKVEESTDRDKMITFHQQGLANANYKGPMATMHKKKLKELLSTKEKKSEVTDTDDGRNYSGQIGNNRWNESLDESADSSSSIKELRKMQSDSLQAHHKFHRECEDKIDAIRNKRGTKLKKVDGGDYFEPGRSAEPSKGPGYY